MAIVGSDTLLIRFQVDGDGRVVASLANVEKGLEGVERRAPAAARGFDLLGKSAAALPVAAVVAFGTAAIAQMDTMRARLVTFTGSADGAARVLERMKPLSRELGASVLDLSDTFIKLTNLGLKPTDSLLRSMANTAAAQGKSINQFAEAVADAATGEFERLKEFGIKSRQEGDSVVFTFKGVETQVAKSASAITGYLERIGNSDYAGAAARQADTLAGSWDKLTNAASGLANAIGDSGLGSALKGTMAWIADVTDETTKLIAKINELRASRGNDPNFADRDRFLQAARSTVPGMQLSNMIELGVAAAQLRADEQRSDTLARLRTRYNELAGAVKDVVAAGQAEVDRNKSVSKSVAELVSQLDDEAATLGKSRSEVLEYRKEKALAKATTDAERQSLAASYDALIATTRAQEAQVKATRDSAKATKDDAQAKREKAQREKEAAAATREAAAAAKAAQDAEDRFADSVQRLVASLVPGGQAAREFAEAMVTLDVALDEKLITPERYEEAIAALQDSQFDARLKELGKDHGDLYADAFLDGTDRIGQGIADAIGAVIFGDGSAADAIASMYRDFVQTQVDAAVQGVQSYIAQRRDSRSSGPDAGVPDLNVAPVTPVGAPGGGGATATGGAAGLTGAVANVVAAYGALAGGSGQGAQVGAGIGAAIGSYWGPIGSAIGSVLGGWIGGYFDEDPSVRVSSLPFGRAEGHARSSFGDIFVRTESVTNPTSDDIAQSVADFDNILASLLTPAQVERVRAAVANINDVAGSLEDVLQGRFAAIIGAVAPEWAGFLNQFGDVEERVRQFKALLNLKDMIGDLDDAVAELAGDPLVALQHQMDKWQENIESTSQSFDMAIDAMDPALVEAAATRSREAIETWAREAIGAAESLEQALFDLARSRRQFEIGLAQRIASLGGAGYGDVINLLGNDVGELRTRVQNGRSPEQSLQYLNEFIDTVDQWLQQSTAEINRQIAALDAERDGILAAGAERAAQAQAHMQIVAQMQQAALDAQRAALQEQLRIAQQWVGVLDQAEQFLERMKFGSENPLGAPLRMELLNQQVEALFAQFRSTTGEEQAGIAGQLLQLLQQQQALGQDLFQRPSPEAIAQYNAILQSIAEIEGVARPEADRARELQEQLAALQEQTVAAVNVQTDAMYYLSSEERARLDEIEEERKGWQEQQEEVNAQAREWYEWAQTEGRRLQTEQHDILQAQLDLLTGGLPVDQFIAQVQIEARDALLNIRDNISSFLSAVGLVGNGLASIGNNGPPVYGGAGLPVQPGNGGGRFGGGPNVVINFAPNASLTGDPQQMLRAFTQVAPQIASVVKRELARA